MKERIVKYKHKKEDCKKCMYEGICSSPLCETEKVEKVPETWEDLKELCKEFGERKILLLENDIYSSGMTFRSNGNVEGFEGDVVGENRTPQQMWDIIKSLVE